jgi:hypothetical protein
MISRSVASNGGGSGRPSHRPDRAVETLSMEQVIICRRSSLSSDGVQPLLGGVRVLLPLGSVRFVGGDNLVCP